ncbi:MAG: hypothetical protein JW750_01225 [Anaerolineaceae bacterium]|nr:hypothetical protein [Anaerolineaceae bacterium]
MSTREARTIYRYLLDAISRRKDVLIDEQLPEDIREDLHFAMWLQAVDFSEESGVKTSLRARLQKQAELVTNAEKRKHIVEVEKRPYQISLPAVIGLVIGGISMVVAAIVVILHVRRPNATDKSAV